MTRRLAASLWLNLALLVAVAWLYRGGTGAPRLSRVPRTPVLAADETAGQTGDAAADATITRGVAKAATPWALIDSADPAVLIQHLRAVGCPEKTVQDIVLLRLAREAQGRVLTLAAAVDAATPYWKVPGRSEQELHSQVAEIRDELFTRLDGLFGDAAPGMRIRMLGLPESYAGEAYLPAEKSVALRRLSREADREERESRSAPGDVPYGWAGAEEEAARRARAGQRDAAIRALLTPAEYEEYLVRESPAARLVRSQFPAASTAAEFRRMVLLAHEAGLGDAPPGFSVNAVPPPEGTDDPMKEWRARAAEFRSRMVTEFGEDRLAAREAEEQSRMKAEQESQDRRELVGIANNAGLSVEEFESFYDSVKGMEAELSERFASALRDASTPEEREVVEAEQEAELEGIAADLLGEEKARRLIDALRARTGQ